MIEPTEVRNDQTQAGTAYTIEKWTCPVCKGQKSSLYIDGEWCHGDSQSLSITGGKGVTFEGCFDCLAKIDGKGLPLPLALEAVDRVVTEYLSEFEARGEDEQGREGDYTPTDAELALITDAVAGLIADPAFVAAYCAWRDLVRGIEPRLELQYVWERGRAAGRAGAMAGDNPYFAGRAPLCKIGDRVHVCEGPLTGISGKIELTDGARAAITIDQNNRIGIVDVKALVIP